MKLLPLDRPGRVELAAAWLARPENNQWLDFGSGITPALLKITACRASHFLRLYTSDLDDTPIGILGLNNVDRLLGTGTLWAVTGDKSFHARGYVSIATSRFMSLAFSKLGLRVINTWAVECNPSLRAIERVGFRFVGRLRQCHVIDGRRYDRLLFDLLASEHRELYHERCRRPERWRERRGAGRMTRPAPGRPGERQ